MRHEQWERRLNEYIAAVEKRPHEYSRHDCLLHCANAVKAVTGKDYGRGHRGKYKSPASAVRHLKAKGFKGPEAFLDSLFEEVPIGFAQRGDLVLTPANDATGWNIPGVVVGFHRGFVALCVSSEGLVSEPPARWLKAWKVGR